MIFQKHQKRIRRFKITRQSKIYLDQEYFTSPIIYSNQNITKTTIWILAYWVEMISEWRDILWGFTETFALRKVLLTKFLSFQSIIMIINFKIYQAVSSIMDYKSWEKCYIILTIIFPCLRVLFMEESNKERTDKLYYYPTTIKTYIQKYWYNIDINYIFPVSISSPNICSNKKWVHCLFYDFLKRQILWNYTFELF